MDLKGSLVDNKIKIYPSKQLQDYISCVTVSDDMPPNILKFVKGAKSLNQKQTNPIERTKTSYNKNDVEKLNKIKTIMKKICKDSDDIDENKSEDLNEVEETELLDKSSNLDKSEHNEIEIKDEKEDLKDKIYLNTDDMDWIYAYIVKKRGEGGNEVPYLHVLFEGSQIQLPENEIIKRNPILEARCVKLRAQQEAREYRKMTKSVDNVRMKFPEDSISYQMKQLNRQLIAIGQFIISIFAGFLFGFRGVEWMVGNLDFGFRLLLGVMCALVIALAEIYFLAKKLNEELNVPETVQLGGPPKFVNEPYFGYKNDIVKKEHQD